MSEPYLGMIMIAGFNFAPTGWATCDGQTMSISQNAALFALLGTTYGGNGTSTFALPDLRSRVAIHQGQGSGLSTYVMGQAAGQENVTLTQGQIPQHTHALNAYSTPGDSHTPVSNFPSASLSSGTKTYQETSDGATMNPGVIGVTGGSQGHNNVQPYLTMNFCIALQGIFPSRN